MHVTLDIAASGPAVVHLAGRLDLLSAGEVKERLAQAVADGHRRLVVDLQDVIFLDSSGLGALISGLKAARVAGGDLRLARAGEQVQLVLRLTTLDRVLRPYPSVEEALVGY